MDVVVVAGWLNCALGASVPLGEVVEVRVDANLFDDINITIHYSDL